jgi:hypothetical protein
LPRQPPAKAGRGLIARTTSVPPSSSSSARRHHQSAECERGLKQDERAGEDGKMPLLYACGCVEYHGRPADDA